MCVMANNIIALIVIFLTLAIVGVSIKFKRERYWSIYQKQYVLLSTCIFLCFIVVFFTSVHDNSISQIVHLIVIPLVTGLIASIVYGVINLESDRDFAEKVSKEVVALLYATSPYRVYPPLMKEIPGKTEFKDNLVESMRKSGSYYYSGVDMTIASICVQTSLESIGYGENGMAIFKEMLFIIPNLNEKEKENNNPITDQAIRQRKAASRKKLIESLRIINVACSKANYPIDAHFYILPQRPTLHIHKTDDMAFLGVVDKVDGCECPTTYCYKKCDIDSDKSSMYSTICNVFIQTKTRLEDHIVPGKHFEVIWSRQNNYGKKEDEIVYKDYSVGNSPIVCNIEKFVDAMSV